MDSNLVPKQIKNIHVVHDLLNDGNKTTYILYYHLKQILLIQRITADCSGIPAAKKGRCKNFIKYMK